MHGRMGVFMLLLGLAAATGGFTLAARSAAADYNLPVQGSRVQLTVLSARQASQLSVQGQDGDARARRRLRDRRGDNHEP